jgi:cell wall-associated NlpC family hydrolase
MQNMIQVKEKNILLGSILMLMLLFTSCFSSQKTGKTNKTGGGDLAFRDRVTTYAQKQVGSSYKYAGTSPETGFDCSGFTSFVLKKFGVPVSPGSSTQATEGRFIAIEKAIPGDLIFFGDGSRIQHVAMVVKNSKEGIICVHSTTSRGVIVENVSTSTYWKPKILFARDVISDN